ncbi:MAG TPA: efflux RND transporter periplasmic adaptor subunit [Candidatus Krumholzibacteria bacterium]|nr:efflux RND transporter periplasmic adaptor subunit [Candidatus Krumholzibacteria bacterium]HPD70367.1 efflux RND transporter periplasmic adaptor subunit [Candidatus Krumholzibacteria bacterium]HRY39933.1 efflux RND transporter periplasmic adaptor subunit [Candidatus Krumholzibacteria bacterium]
MDRCCLATFLLLLAGCSGRELPNPSGTFEATVVDVAPVMSGRALVVRPDEGEAVALGDTVIVLDTELLALQRAETAARRASLEAQRRSAAADLAQAQSRLALVETTLSRTTELRNLGTATQQQVDDLTAERDVTRSAIEAARGRLATVDAELAHLEAALAVLDRQLRDGVVLAPVAGTVLTRNLEPGEVAAAGRTAMRVADLSELELEVYLEAGDLDRVRLGDTLPVVIDATPGERRQGRVTWISDEAEFTPKNAQTRDARAQLVYAVKLRVANPDGRLHVGMPAEVELP